MIPDIRLLKFKKEAENEMVAFIYSLMILATCRRNSIDLGNKGRRSRRGSVDINAAEYEIKMDKKKNISELKQTTSLHMKREDADGRAKHGLYKQRRDAIEADGWEPYQEWFYDNEFRLGKYLQQQLRPCCRQK